MQVQNSQRGLRFLRSASNLHLRLPGPIRLQDVWLRSANAAGITDLPPPRRSISIGLAMRRARSRNKSKGLVTNLSSLFKPVQIQHNVLVNDVGCELAGKLEKPAILKILNKFTQKKEIKVLCQENGLDSKLSGFTLTFCFQGQIQGIKAQRLRNAGIWMNKWISVLCILYTLNSVIIANIS